METATIDFSVKDHVGFLASQVPFLASSLGMFLSAVLIGLAVLIPALAVYDVKRQRRQDRVYRPGDEYESTGRNAVTLIIIALVVFVSFFSFVRSASAQGQERIQKEFLHSVSEQLLDGAGVTLGEICTASTGRMGYMGYDDRVALPAYDLPLCKMLHGEDEGFFTRLYSGERNRDGLDLEELGAVSMAVVKGSPHVVLYDSSGIDRGSFHATVRLRPLREDDDTRGESDLDGAPLSSLGY